VFITPYIKEQLMYVYKYTNFNKADMKSALQFILNVMNLELNNITLQNFGPYGNKKIQYPLSKRGLVLIKGKLLDGTGADSNGSGKTTLAMSVLWCLTGSMDTRLIADGRSHDVTNDASSSTSSKAVAAVEVKFDDVQASGSSGSSSKKVAEVTLEGIINEKPFQIIRRKGARKQELFFIVDGVDQTTQSIKDTQQKIDETLGIGTGLLQRCYFFGQHSHTSQVSSVFLPSSSYLLSSLTDLDLIDPL
jgi:DNA repair exonuclease SbcCD ATPase subunit